MAQKKQSTTQKLNNLGIQWPAMLPVYFVPDENGKPQPMIKVEDCLRFASDAVERFGCQFEAQDPPAAIGAAAELGNEQLLSATAGKG